MRGYNFQQACKIPSMHDGDRPACAQVVHVTVYDRMIARSLSLAAQVYQGYPLAKEIR
jgi:hypothetical protein